MISDHEWETFSRQFPALQADRRSETLLKKSCVVRRVNDGDILYRDGDDCTHLPLVISGELQLTKYGETGRAITLYRVEDGESCILSTLSILNAAAFPAEATSRSSTTLFLVPAEVLRRLIENETNWREFVFSTYHQRLAALIALIEEVVFGKLDVRLAELLLKSADRGEKTLGMTHQELAEELGSSREVVSRILKEWERQGIVALRRGFVTISEVQSLRKKAR